MRSRRDSGMMSRFTFSIDPPPHWDKFCVSRRALFHSPSWQNLIDKTLGSTTIYGWNNIEEAGLAINIFRAGIFRVGYLGFPVGGLVGGHDHKQVTPVSLTEAEYPVALHCLRIPVSAFDRPMDIDLPHAVAPETAIVDLPNWRLENHSDVRRDINKVNRMGLEIVDKPDAALADTAFRLYRDTVMRNKGGLRYKQNYFRALAELSKTHQALRFIFALKEQQVAGFIVVAQHGDTVYYLHGGTETACRRYSPSDILLYEAIRWAQTRGVSCFNLMASPAKQASLISYKEKWGGITRQHMTYTLAIKSLPCRLFLGAERLYQLLR
jgi:Acetyltransferase (GNAT) domain